MTLTLRAGLVLLAALHLLLGYSHNFLVGPDDDRLWLYTAGIDVGRADEAAELNGRVHASFNAMGTSPNQRVRFALREGYHRNYVGAALVHGTAAAVARTRLGALRETDYPAFVSRAMYSSFVTMYVATCLVLLAVAVSVSDRRWLTAVVVSIAAIALLESLFDLAGDQWSGLPMLLPEAGSSQTYWQTLGLNLPALFVNPQIQLSPFGDTPRNHFILLMIPLFLLRWTGWIATSYVFLAALGFLHQSHTGLVLAFLVAIDAVLRPWVFRSRVLLLIGAISVMFAGRESLGSVIGMTRPVVLVTAAVAVTVIGACVFLGLRGQGDRMARLLAPWRERLLSRGVIVADLAMIGVVLLVSLPVVAAINAMGTKEQSLYFWTQVHGRSLGIFRPALMLGLAFWALSSMERRLGQSRALAAGMWLAVAALVPSVLEAAMHDRQPIRRIERQVRVLDESIGPSIDWTTIGSKSETEIYYAIARTLDIGR